MEDENPSNGKGTVVVIAEQPGQVPADPIPPQVTIEAPPVVPEATPEQIQAAAAAALEAERTELRQELQSAETLNRLRSDTQSLRDQMQNLSARLEAQQVANAEALSALTAELRGVLVALTEEEEAEQQQGDPAQPEAPTLELAPPRRSIWDMLR